jgi:HPt (histidine-containing phosphotransfer) domain-containing protein
MAIHYNLAKVYAISEDDKDFVIQILKLFVDEVPVDLKKIKKGIKSKDYEKTYASAHKIKPSLDFLGLDSSFEDIIQIEDWTRNKGKKKEIKEIFKSMANKIELTIEEIKSDFEL